MDAQTVDVLLVEDNPADAELTIRALSRRNLAHSLIHLKDGQEAMDWLFGTGQYSDRDPRQKPKIILLDLKLPKVDGLEVLRAIRSDSRTHFIPVVVLTSSREEQDVVASYRLGINSYIVKPVDFEKFSHAVAETGHYWLQLNELMPAAGESSS